MLDTFTLSEWLAWLASAAAIVASYFLGNISPAIIMGKLKGVDIKSEGSGNAGTTNVLRVIGMKAAIGTLGIDILKGAIAVLLGKFVGLWAFTPEFSLVLQMFCGLAVFCGHIWPMAFKFKGGKGVATAFGVVVALQPMLGATLAVIVLATIAITRKVSLGSLVGAVCFPILAVTLFPVEYPLTLPLYYVWTIAMAAIILVKHKENIHRLINKEEENIKFK